MHRDRLRRRNPEFHLIASDGKNGHRDAVADSNNLPHSPGQNKHRPLLFVSHPILLPLLYLAITRLSLIERGLIGYR
jgi:hypothetical protein